MSVLIVPIPSLRALLAGLAADADEVEAAMAASSDHAIEHEWMAAGIRWAINAIESELLGGAGTAGDE